MPISPRTVEFLNELGHEVTHAAELSMAQSPDEDIVEFAKSNGFAILTEDLDFAAILAVTRAIEPGVMILRVGNWNRGQIERRLEHVLSRTDRGNTVQLYRHDRSQSGTYSAIAHKMSTTEPLNLPKPL